MAQLVEEQQQQQQESREPMPRWACCTLLIAAVGFMGLAFGVLGWPMYELGKEVPHSKLSGYMIWSYDRYTDVSGTYGDISIPSVWVRTEQPYVLPLLDNVMKMPVTNTQQHNNATWMERVAETTCCTLYDKNEESYCDRYYRACIEGDSKGVGKGCRAALCKVDGPKYCQVLEDWDEHGALPKQLVVADLFTNIHQVCVVKEDGEDPVVHQLSCAYVMDATLSDEMCAKGVNNPDVPHPFTRWLMLEEACTRHTHYQTLPVQYFRLEDDGGHLLLDGEARSLHELKLRYKNQRYQKIVDQFYTAFPDGG